jgi:hypothetical protein
MQYPATYLRHIIALPELLIKYIGEFNWVYVAGFDDLVAGFRMPLGRCTLSSTLEINIKLGLRGLYTYFIFGRS